jgi:hypothetical protein
MKTQSTTEPEIPRELTEEQKQRKRERNRHVNMTPGLVLSSLSNLLPL